VLPPATHSGSFKLEFNGSDLSSSKAVLRVLPRGPWMLRIVPGRISLGQSQSLVEHSARWVVVVVRAAVTFTRRLEPVRVTSAANEGCLDDRMQALRRDGSRETALDAICWPDRTELDVQQQRPRGGNERSRTSLIPRWLVHRNRIIVGIGLPVKTQSGSGKKTALAPSL
jgi:hypothetical protein